MGCGRFRGVYGADSRASCETVVACVMLKTAEWLWEKKVKIEILIGIKFTITEVN